MIIIADAGSTKTEWAVIGGPGPGETARFATSGFNAAVSSTNLLREILEDEAPALLSLARGATDVFYYGAGCAGARAAATASALGEVFATALCHVESDMLGAARALCGNEAGIVCILGTGSNSCLYDGRSITANVPPMGFILGDEGSGAVLGKLFLGRLFKGGFGEETSARFRTAFPDTDASTVIERVYRFARPNAYLASFAPFIASALDIPEVEEFVVSEFEHFFAANVLRYEGARSLPVNFAGSVACHFAPQLHTAALRQGVSLGKILKNPLDALIRFHTRN